MRSLLPHAIAEDPTVAAVSEAVEPELETLRLAAPVPNILGRLATASRAVLDEVARYLGVDLYDPGAGDDVVLALIQGAFGWHRRRGTAWSLRWVLAALGLTSAEVITPAEARVLARAGGVRFVGDEGDTVDDTIIVGYVGATGLPELLGWAEFYVLLDLDVERTVEAGGGWGAQVERAVRLASPASRRAVYVCRFASGSEYAAQGALLEVRRALGPAYDCYLLYNAIEGQPIDGSDLVVATAVVARRLDVQRVRHGRYATPVPDVFPDSTVLVLEAETVDTATIGAPGSGWRVNRYEVEFLGQTYRRATASLVSYPTQSDALVSRTPSDATLLVTRDL